MSDEGPAIIAAIIALKAAIVGGWFLVFFVGERVMSAAQPRGGIARLLRNGGLWLIVLLISPLIVAPLTAMGANAFLWTRPSWVGAGLLILVVDIILLDLWTYWVHRAYHRIPFLWRFHQVHHFDEFLDTTSAFRFHFGEVIISAVLRLAPVALLAAPLTHVIVFEVVLLCTAVFHHSNIRLSEAVERPLSRVIVTPSIHWVHHHATMADTNSNYAAVFSVWDRLFASRSLTRRTSDMKIGIKDIEDKGFFWLILTPFLRRLR